MAKTEEQHRDDYLKKTYGISLDEHNKLLESQGGLCGICREQRKEGAKNFAVDHDHKALYFRIDSKKENGIWTALLSTEQDENCYCAPSYYMRATMHSGKTKSEAIRSLRKELKRLSVRGLLCFKCNTLLRKLYDSARIAHNASIYLARHQTEGVL